MLYYYIQTESVNSNDTIFISGISLKMSSVTQIMPKDLKKYSSFKKVDFQTIGWFDSSELLNVMKALSEGVTEVNFSTNIAEDTFQRIIENLPKGIKKISFSADFNHNYTHGAKVLPSNIKEVEFSGSISLSVIKTLPGTVERIRWNDPRHFYFYSNENNPYKKIFLEEIAPYLVQKEFIFHVQPNEIYTCIRLLFPLYKLQEINKQPSESFAKLLKDLVSSKDAAIVAFALHIDPNYSPEHLDYVLPLINKRMSLLTAFNLYKEKFNKDIFQQNIKPYLHSYIQEVISKSNSYGLFLYALKLDKSYPNCLSILSVFVEEFLAIGEVEKSQTLYEIISVNRKKEEAEEFTYLGHLIDVYRKDEKQRPSITLSNMKFEDIDPHLKHTQGIKKLVLDNVTFQDIYQLYSFFEILNRTNIEILEFKNMKCNLAPEFCEKVKEILDSNRSLVEFRGFIGSNLEQLLQFQCNKNQKNVTKKDKMNQSKITDFFEHLSKDNQGEENGKEPLKKKKKH